jgi:hypothetical protein
MHTTHKHFKNAILKGACGSGTVCAHTSQDLPPQAGLPVVSAASAGSVAHEGVGTPLQCGYTASVPAAPGPSSSCTCHVGWWTPLFGSTRQEKGTQPGWAEPEAQSLRGPEGGRRGPGGGGGGRHKGNPPTPPTPQLATQQRLGGKAAESKTQHPTARTHPPRQSHGR